jgi:hypothetical protein
MFAVFENLESFDNWHNSVLEKLDYPLVGHNAATDLPDNEHLITKYTEARINKNDPRVIAWVGEETEGLEIIDETDSEWSDWFISRMPWESAE